jgi:hypothetical protein
MPRKKSLPATVYQLKITLKGIRPPIWRRILVPGDVFLGDLHAVIQIAMGWYNSHLHEFTINGQSYGEPMPEYGTDVRSERRVRLDQLIPREKGRLTYLYDFGDGWEHEVLVEKIMAPDASAHYPCCIGGKRVCPPKDVGGVWGYAEFLEAIGDPQHPDHESMVEWIDEEFDSESFDIESVNKQLAALR